jgi:hypothetical protein
MEGRFLPISNASVVLTDLSRSLIMPAFMDHDSRFTRINHILRVLPNWHSQRAGLYAFFEAKALSGRRLRWAQWSAFWSGPT